MVLANQKHLLCAVLPALAATAIAVSDVGPRLLLGLPQQKSVLGGEIQLLHLHWLTVVCVLMVQPILEGPEDDIPNGILVALLTPEAIPACQVKPASPKVHILVLSADVCALGGIQAEHLFADGAGG